MEYVESPEISPIKVQFNESTTQGRSTKMDRNGIVGIIEETPDTKTNYHDETVKTRKVS